MLREQQDPAVRLRDAIERYIDALHVAAEHVVGKSAAQALEGFANRLVPGLTDEPAWPTLRARLLLLAADGADPHERLRDACEASEISSADDRAAVLDWRLDNASPRSSRDGPLPWLPGIPDRIAADPTWGPYLDARSRLVTQLADQVRLTADGDGWAASPMLPCRPSSSPTCRYGAPPPRSTPATCDRPGHSSSVAPLEPSNSNSTSDSPLRLPTKIGDGGNCSPQKSQAATADPFLPELTERLSNLSRAGFDATLLVRSAAAEGPLPDDHPAAALWWRILDQLAPQMPNRHPATPNPVPTTRHTATTSPRRQRPVPRSTPPPAFGPSR